MVAALARGLTLVLAARTHAADDKKMNATLKKLGVTNIPGIEEANMFKDNGEVIHFKNPKGACVRACALRALSVIRSVSDVALSSTVSPRFATLQSRPPSLPRPTSSAAPPRPSVSGQCNGIGA